MKGVVDRQVPCPAICENGGIEGLNINETSYPGSPALPMVMELHNIWKNKTESESYKDRKKRVALVNRGLELLKKYDPEDTDYMRLRVIEKDEIWVVYNGEGYTFMKPEDY